MSLRHRLYAAALTWLVLIGLATQPNAWWQSVPQQSIVVSPGSSATWNPSDKSADVSLSGGDLVATSAIAAHRAVRATASASSGQKYWEITLTAAGTGPTTVSGIGNASALLSNFPGVNADSFGWNNDGTVYWNSAAQGSGAAAYTTGDVLCFAFDIDANKYWFRKNGGSWLPTGDPAAGTGGLSNAAHVTGPFFPMSSVGDNAIITVNFGGTAYAQTPPSGFGNWNFLLKRDLDPAANDNTPAFLDQVA